MTELVHMSTLELEPVAPELGIADVVNLWLRGQPSTNTRRTYRGALAAFSASCGAPVETTIRGLLQGRKEAHALVSAYRAKMLEDGLASSTINLRLSALRSLVGKAEELGLIEWSLKTKGVRQRKYRDTRGPGRSGFLRLLQAATHTRDKAIVWLLYGMALRNGEVVSLDLHHVDLDGGRIQVMGKGRREREYLTLPSRVVQSLGGWIDVRGSDPGPLFHNLDHGHVQSRITSGGIRDLLSRLGKRAGLKAHPHGLRHAGISEALDKSNGNIRAVQKYSRHADPKTLLHYDDSRRDLGGEIAALVVDSTSLDVPVS